MCKLAFIRGFGRGSLSFCHDHRNNRNQMSLNCTVIFFIYCVRARSDFSRASLISSLVHVVSKQFDIARTRIITPYT